MAQLDLDTALAMVAAARRAAQELIDRPLAYAVVDAGGHVIVQARDDGAGFLRGTIAANKAWGCIAMALPSRTLAEQSVGYESWFVGVNGAAGGRLVPVPGGVVVRDAGGAAIGAVGVSGAPSAIDEQVAVAAIEAAGFTAESGAP